MRKRNARVGSPRQGLTILEIQVALVIFAVALSGLYPLVLMQSKQLRKMETWLKPQTMYFLVPSSDAWARKLGAVAAMQPQDPGPVPPPPVLNIDNGEAGYTEIGTGWGAETQKKAYQETLRWHASGTGENKVTWNFTGLQAGWYDVQATWLEGGNRATNSPFKVYFGSTLKGTYLVNQKLAPAGEIFGGRPWKSLAKLSLANTTVQVELSDNADDRVVADGVRLVPIRNIVQVLSLARSLTNEEVTAHVSITVQVPP